ncbi:MAG: hypothetical protein ACI843_001792, partial [Psychrobacter glaciei]
TKLNSVIEADKKALLCFNLPSFFNQLTACISTELKTATP